MRRTGPPQAERLRSVPGRELDPDLALRREAGGLDDRHTTRRWDKRKRARDLLKVRVGAAVRQKLVQKALRGRRRIRLPKEAAQRIKKVAR